MEISFDSLAEMFETRKRDNGRDFVTLKDSAPEWAREFVMEAHGTDMLPDDYRYQWIADALEALAASPDATPEEVGDEWADQVDVYTSGLLEWAGSHLARIGYCDQAQEEGLIGEDADMVKRLQAGQYMERREVFQGVLSAIEKLEV